MPVDPIPSQEEIDRKAERHRKNLRVRGEANTLLRYFDSAEAAADAAGIP